MRCTWQPFNWCSWALKSDSCHEIEFVLSGGTKVWHVGILHHENNFGIVVGIAVFALSTTSSATSDKVDILTNLGFQCIYSMFFNTLRPRQDGRHYPDDVFKIIFLNENVQISIKISLKFIPKGPINIIPALESGGTWMVNNMHVVGFGGNQICTQLRACWALGRMYPSNCMPAYTRLRYIPIELYPQYLGKPGMRSYRKGSAHNHKKTLYQWQILTFLISM